MSPTPERIHLAVDGMVPQVTEAAEPADEVPEVTTAHAIDPDAAHGGDLVIEGALTDIDDEEDDTPELRRPPRVRLVGPRESVERLHTRLAETTAGDPDLAVYDGEVTTAARLELLPFLQEQAISITAHRYGNPDSTFDEVI